MVDIVFVPHRITWRVVQLQVALWKSVLDPVQGAKLVVESWPQFPDAIAVMNTVAEIEGPSASKHGYCDHQANFAKQRTCSN